MDEHQGCDGTHKEYICNACQRSLSVHTADVAVEFVSPDKPHFIVCSACLLHLGVSGNILMVVKLSTRDEIRAEMEAEARANIETLLHGRRN